MKKLVVIFAALALGIAAHAQKVETLPNGNTVETLSDGEVWVTIKSSDFPIQVTPDMPTAGEFQTNVLRNLPGSDIVNGAQSIKIQIWGDCRTRTYQIMGMLLYSGKKGSGQPDVEGSTGPDGVVRQVEAGSLIEKVFLVACK